MELISKRENTKRLAKNTLMLYFRMLFSMLVSIYSSRVILDALGESDYGVYNVVGGLVTMFSIITSSLSTAISRFQTFELGRKDEGRLNAAFSASFIIQLLMAVVAFVLAETLGVWFLNTHMTIDADRMYAANWVMQCSILTFMTTLLMVPYSASVVAHEKMDVLTIISFFEVVFKLLIALFLAFVAHKGDNLILYAILLLVSTWMVQIIYVIYCKAHFKECCLSFKFNKRIFKEILSFASWNIFGGTAVMLNGQGVNIVLNMIFGPAVNAARGLAVTVNNIIGNFVNNFTMALNPQIIKAFAADEQDYLHSLVERGTKFSYFILLILGVPVLLEADFLLDLWLVDVPEHTVNFVRLVLLLSFADISSGTLNMAQMATGKIRKYQIITSCILSLNFVFSFFCLRWGMQPEIIYVIAIIISLCVFFARLEFSHHSIGLSIVHFFQNVILKVLFVALLSSIVPVLITISIDDGWVRFLIVSFVSVSCTACSVLLVGCSQGEREFIFKGIKTFAGRINVIKR